MDKYDILAIVAPVAAPAAPATMLVNILYSDLKIEAVSNGFAMTSAVLSGIGAEASGMIAAYVGIQAFRKKKWGLMLVAICAFIVYAVFMAVGISVAKNPVTMVSTIVISIIAYISVASLSDLRGAASEVVGEFSRDIERMRAQTDLEKAQASKERALARQRESSPKVTAENQKVSESFGNDWRRVPDEHRAKIARMNTKQISETYKVSERTALNWLKYSGEGE